jgi:hypothetical protein
MSAKRSDRGGVARALLITVAVLVLLLVAADRIGDAVAERYAADTIQSSQHLPNRPGVDITGFPFLTQLATGNFDDIIVSDNELPLGSAAVKLSTIRISLHHVHVARDLSSVHADTADAVATMSYADLGRALGGVRVRYIGEGRIAASKSITIAGHTVRGGVSASPRLLGTALAFGSDRFSGLGPLIQQAAPILRKIFDLRIPLDAIPFDITVRSLDAGPNGLEMALVGHNLTYSH